MGSHSENARPRLTRADYEAQERPLSRETVRSHFLDAVAQVEPAVIATLAAEPFVLYTDRVAPRIASIDHLDLEHTLRFDSTIPEHWGESLQPLRLALLTWAERWHLTAPWCIGRALGTLGEWSYRSRFASLLPRMAERRWYHPDFVPQAIFPRSPLAAKSHASAGVTPLARDWSEAGHGPEEIIKESLHFFIHEQEREQDILNGGPPLTLPGWNFPFVSEQSAKAHYDAEVKAAWARHVAETKAWMRDHGFIPVIAKRNLDEHCIWLARVVVLRHNYKQIVATDRPAQDDERAPDDGRDYTKTVKDAIKTLAEQIELPISVRRGPTPNRAR